MKREHNAAVDAATEEAPAAVVLANMGLIGGEILVALDTCGPISMRDLTRKLDWSSDLILMAAGALAHQRRIEATVRNGAVFIAPLGDAAATSEATVVLAES